MPNRWVPPAVYGKIACSSISGWRASRTPQQDEAVAALERAGHPVVRIGVADRYQIGQEFFRWEFATAVAGSIIGINPFDQPDVEASKDKTRELTTAYEKTGKLPAETPLLQEDGIYLFADERNAARRFGKAGNAGRDYLAAHLVANSRRRLFRAARLCRAQRSRITPHSRKSASWSATASASRPASVSARAFFIRRGRPTRADPNTGVFLQITCDDAPDLDVPGQKYSFGVVKAAQARGDFQVLVERGRRALRVHLGAHVAAGLDRAQGRRSSEASR